jgi:outer membrane protein assembly factor BamB
MRRARVLLLSTVIVVQTLAAAAANWPSFRGPAASGIGEGAPAPLTWDVPANKNVKWRVAVPGLAHSSPVVWGNQICLGTAVSNTASADLKVGLYGNIESANDQSPHRWMVICYDKATGKQLWERTAHAGVPQVKRHTKSTHASSTLATDGRYIVAFFGSEGLYAFDMKGAPVWSKNFGVLDSGFFMVPDAQWGFASSPVIHGNRVIVQADVQKGSFVAALDLATGKELWRTSRADVPTFSTPAVVTSTRRAQVVVNGWKHIGGYDLETGKEIWRMTGGGDIPVPTPIAAHGLVFITNSHGGKSPVFAVKPSAEGDITLNESETSSAHIAWSVPRDGSYLQTPLVYEDLFYVCKDNGVLAVFDARSGERRYQARLADGKTGFSASPVASNGRIYFTSEEGDVYVIKAGPAFEQLAVNPLGEVAMATPAISDGVMFFRTRSHLVAVQ